MNDILRAHVALRGDGGQAELARQLNVSEPTISRWVTGRSVPEEHRAAAIAAAVGSDEATILSAIGLAKKHRQEAADELQSQGTKDAELQRLRSVVEDLSKQIGGMEALLQELLAERHQPGRGEGRGGKRNSH